MHIKFWFTKILRLLFISTLLVLVTACSEHNFFVVVSDNYNELAEKYPVLKKHGFTVMTQSAYSALGKENNHVKLELYEAEPFETVPEQFICIGQEIWVPAVPLHSMKISISKQELKAYFIDKLGLPADVILLPLQKLSLPFKAIPIEGSYINDSDYPLVCKLYAHLTVNGNEESLETEREKFFFSTAQHAWNEKQFSIFVKAVQDWLMGTGHRAEKLFSEGESLEWVVAVGDVMLGRGIDERLKREGAEAVFTDTLPHLKQGAITACNFEASLSQGKGPIPKSYNFFVPPWALSYLKEAGFTYLTLTNNHVWDYGIDGFIETLVHIQESGLATSGAGMNLEEAEKPWFIEKGTTRFCVLSVAAYPQEKNGFNGKELASAGKHTPGILFSGKGAEAAMEKYFSTKTFNIVFVHGGIEGSSVPGAEYENLYRSFVDRGANLVIGSHPHILQRMEAYNGALIAYSLGDFLFAEMDDVPGGEDGLILKVGIVRGKIVYVEAVPVKLSYIDVRVKHDVHELAQFMSLQ